MGIHNRYGLMFGPNGTPLAQSATTDDLSEVLPFSIVMYDEDKGWQQYGVFETAEKADRKAAEVAADYGTPTQVVNTLQLLAWCKVNTLPLRDLSLLGGFGGAVSVFNPRGLRRPRVVNTCCILSPRRAEDGVRVSTMSRHTLNDGVTPDERIKDFDLWMPELSPGGKLVGAWHRGEVTWEEFTRRYLERLERPEAQKAIAELLRHPVVTVMCIEDEPDRCHRSVLQAYLMRWEPMRTLRERLADWTDFDGAAYELGVLLGLFPKEYGEGDGLWHGTKGIFWSANPLGDALHAALQELVKAGVLEFDSASGPRYRWNPDYEVEFDTSG